MTDATASTPLKRTPLRDVHVKAGAKMVPFGGWDMPVQYTGIIDEHRTVRGAVGLFDISHMGEFEVRGADALASVQRLCTNDASTLAIGQVQYAALCYPVAGVEGLISRTGYTGEDGFELYVAAGQAERLWFALLEAGRGDGIKPIGLGARDTLRLEMKYALYGNDIDQTTNPLEAGLGWVVKPAKGEFIGRAAIEGARSEGLRRRLVGLEMADRSIARHEYPVVKDGRRIGVITSGSYGPSVDRSIALAYVESAHASVGTGLAVEIRGQARAARVVRTPF